MKRSEYIEKLNRIILILNDKLQHNLKIHHCYEKDKNPNAGLLDLLEFTTDVICERCNINFELDLVNRKYYDNLFEDVTYCFNCFALGDGLSALNCINIKCHDFIIKGIIE